MRIPVFLFSTLISLQLFCQKDTTLLVKFCPPAILDFVGLPTFQAGLELKLSHRISWYNEWGIKYANSPYNQTDTSFVGSRGYKAKTEIRYHLKNTRKNQPALEGNYLAANAFFISDSHNKAIDYFKGKDSTHSLRDEFGVNKKVWGLNLLIGVQRTIEKRFLFDMYIGLGIRFRYINNSNLQFDDKTDIAHLPIDYSIPAQQALTEAKGGFSMAPNLTIGFRLCYRL